MNFIEKIKNAGVVGAGGAGFPTHVKMGTTVEWLLVNAAECEPLMHKDKELMQHYADTIVQGIKLAAEHTKAQKIVIGIKSKNTKAIASLNTAIKKANSPATIHEFADYYPAGDEYEIVAGITGKLIPPAGIPLDIGAVVSNIETLYNIARAVEDIPVIHKYMTIAGAVKNPVTVCVPIGTSYDEVLSLAGGSTLPAFAVIENGVMMGQQVSDLRKTVTKQTGGLIVLPADHRTITRYQKSTKEMNRIGKSACDQCSYCTEFCPRYLLGYDIQPHLVMRGLGFTAMGQDFWNQYASLCCNCGLCTLYACPEDLYPREACFQAKANMQVKPDHSKHKPIKIHPMKEYRRIPGKQLQNKLGIRQYDVPTGFIAEVYKPKEVRISLQQHIGAAAVPVVEVNELVQTGQLIAHIPEGKLGAPVHASISGRVQEITDALIRIEG